MATVATLFMLEGVSSPRSNVHQRAGSGNTSDPVNETHPPLVESDFTHFTLHSCSEPGQIPVLVFSEAFL